MALRKPETAYERALIDLRLIKNDIEEIQNAHNKLLGICSKEIDEIAMCRNHINEFKDKLNSDYTHFNSELKKIIGD